MEGSSGLLKWMYHPLSGRRVERERTASGYIFDGKAVARVVTLREISIKTSEMAGQGESGSAEVLMDF